MKYYVLCHNCLQVRTFKCGTHREVSKTKICVCDSTPTDYGKVLSIIMIDAKDIPIETEDEECKYESIPFERIASALSKISGKWKLKLLYLIGYSETIRYGELKRKADPISHKMLSEQLKELAEDGLIIRTEYPQIPPKVEYSLSEKGYGLLPMFEELFEWIVKFDIK